MNNIDNKKVNECSILKIFLIFLLIFVVCPIVFLITGILFLILGPILGIFLDEIISNHMREPACIGIMLILTLIVFLLWFVFGRDKHVTPIVSFEPPKDTNSAELEVNCYGCSSERGIKSLIYYLESKGYLKIEKLNNIYVLKKLKSYDGNDEVEKVFFDGIFSEDEETVNLNRFISSNSFYFLSTNIQSILSQLNKDNFKNDTAMVSKIFIMLLCIGGIGLSLLFTLLDYSLVFIFSPITLMFGFTLIAMWAAVYFCCNYKQQTQVPVRVNGKYPKNHKKLYTTLFMLFWCAGFGGFPFITILQYDIIKFNHPIETIIGLVCLIICFICVVNMPRLSKKGRELRGLAIGFKKFLEVTEKRRFDELINQNPNYAKEIYPYAFALGITESYITDLDVLAASGYYAGDDLNPENIKQIYDLLNKTK